MQKATYSISIKASPQTVWQTLWDESTYGKWTAPFCEGSQAITDWKEGSKVLFLAGSGDGMVSVIERKTPGEFMSFKHIGFVKNGVEDLESESVKQWAGSLENYTLIKEGENTRVEIEQDISDEHKSYIDEAWPKALEQLKKLAENP